MEIKAEKFRCAPGHVYRAADKGKDVTIRHSHYPHREFKLVAVDSYADAGLLADYMREKLGEMDKIAKGVLEE